MRLSTVQLYVIPMSVKYLNIRQFTFQKEKLILFIFRMKCELNYPYTVSIPYKLNPNVEN